nr:GNAT family N-acetyltransferase [uncultured Flavobacterium sp.]
MNDSRSITNMNNNLKFIRTDAEDPNFNFLVTQLDADLRVRNGDFHTFHGQFNKLKNIKQVIVVFVDDVPVGCGAIKEFTSDTIEIKRMYVIPGKQGMGIATSILKELEKWSLELGYSSFILQTGVNQPEAIGLYHKNNYKIIPNFGQYKGDDNSVCFEKKV